MIRDILIAGICRDKQSVRDEKLRNSKLDLEKANENGRRLNPKLCLKKTPACCYITSLVHFRSKMPVRTAFLDPETLSLPDNEIV